MTLITIPMFLIGNRKAIYDIATSRNSILVGLFLVLSAGLAREYDAEYLLKEPWHVLISLGASLAASFLFFSMAYWIGRRRGIADGKFWPSYRAFVALFWMTAPLAWLYAIPFERFCDPIEATSANLWTLKIVSVWRVVLMIRVVAVFFGCSVWAACFCVVLVADITMMGALAVAPLPVIQIMGGIRLSDTAALVASTACMMRFFGTISMPLWILGMVVVASRRGPHWILIDLEPRTRATRATVILALCTVLMWLVVLPKTQAEQHARYETEELLIGGRIREGLALMSQQGVDAYPPLWDPPPRPDFRIYEPKLTDVMLSILDEPPSEWVADIYGEKFRRWLGIGQPYSAIRWRTTTRREVEEILTVIEQLPEGPAYASELLRDVEHRQKELGEDIMRRFNAISDRE